MPELVTVFDFPMFSRRSDGPSRPIQRELKKAGLCSSMRVPALAGLREMASRLCLSLPLLPAIKACLLLGAGCAHAFSFDSFSSGALSSAERNFWLVASASQCSRNRKSSAEDWGRRRAVLRHALGLSLCGPACRCSSLPAESASDGNESLQNEEYELKAAPYKKKLLAKLPGKRRANATVVEIGIGAFSTAASYPADFCGTVIGIEPDTPKHPAAKSAAMAVGIHLEMEAGLAENLPLPDGSVDAVVTACTLCSVQDPWKSLQEVKRVLKPGGRLFFFEHILSETDPWLARRQIEATPEEVRRWGCHFDRRTLEAIKVSGFASLHGIDEGGKECYIEMPDLDLMGPTAVGIAATR